MLYCEIRQVTEFTTWKKILKTVTPSRKTSYVRSVKPFCAVNLMLRERGMIGFREIDRKTLANVFASLVVKLARKREIRLLFPRQNEEGAIRRALRQANVEYKKEGSWLLAGPSTKENPILGRVLEAVSFTEFYAQVEGSGPIPKKVRDLFGTLENHYFICLFSLYDESMEIYSKFLKGETVVEVVRQVGKEMGFPVELANKTQRTHPD